MEVTNESIGQMTIFYSGEVSVFDDISGDKVNEAPHFDEKYCIQLL